MKQVNVHEAKTRLSQLLLAVERGEEVVIARDGRPVARLTAYSKPAKPREPGSARGRFSVPDSFFEPMPESFLEDFGL